MKATCLREAVERSTPSEMFLIAGAGCRWGPHARRRDNVEEFVGHGDELPSRLEDRPSPSARTGELTSLYCCFSNDPWTISAPCGSCFRCQARQLLASRRGVCSFRLDRRPIGRAARGSTRPDIAAGDTTRSPAPPTERGEPIGSCEQYLRTSTALNDKVRGEDAEPRGPKSRPIASAAACSAHR